MHLFVVVAVDAVAEAMIEFFGLLKMHLLQD